MYLLISKIIFAASIFLLTVITGFIPLKIAKHNTRLFGLCDSFSSGIFLSAALLHLLPEAVAKFNTIYSHEYPLAYLVCLVTYIILLIMERGASIYNSLHPANNKVVMPIFLASLFIVHSVVEGAAIGANTTFLEAATIFFAVFAHKSSESFTLTVNLHRFGVSTKSIRKTILLFLNDPFGDFYCILYDRSFS
ncbi:MAG: ZIP family metal transporter [Gammaproteobacteria bacterium]|nr:ZIP family metal transporter [Gammaproteobacteria bacterium]